MIMEAWLAPMWTAARSFSEEGSGIVTKVIDSKGVVFGNSEIVTFAGRVGIFDFLTFFLHEQRVQGLIRHAW
jgi:hypothetical protein